MIAIYFLQTVAVFIFNRLEGDEIRWAPKIFSCIWFGSLAIVYWSIMRMLVCELKAIDPVRELEDFSAERRKLTG